MSASYLKIAKDLWSAADQLRANSGLKSSQYQKPILGLVFLKYANFKFQQVKGELEGKRIRGTQAADRLKTACRARGALYLCENAQFEYLLNLTDGDDRAGAIIEGMNAIEADNPELKDVLPKDEYRLIDKPTLGILLKQFNNILTDVKGDVFGYIYMYFLGEFSKSQKDNKGGEFFTPNCLARLIVQIVEPRRGRLYDPSNGAGGTFVESIRYNREQLKQNPSEHITIYGQEIVGETVNLCLMNLAVHGIFVQKEQIRETNTYYNDLHSIVGMAAAVMANPPFNVDDVDRERLVGGEARFPFGLPKANNANYIWIQIFYSALSETGRAGFVMANSATDAELEIRQKLILTGHVDVIISIASNFFYNVTLPCTLWFFDKGKPEIRRDKVLFVDARNLYRQVSRALREFKSGCIEKDALAERFPDLETIPDLLVESPIDDIFWDWNEAIANRQTVKDRIAPVSQQLLEQAKPLVAAVYPFSIYESAAAPLLKDEPEAVQTAILALIRVEAFKKLDDQAVQLTLEIPEQKLPQAIARKVMDFKLERDIQEEGEERQTWLIKKLETFNRAAQKTVLNLLHRRELLLDRQRSALPLDDADVMGSLDGIYSEDLEQALKLWQDTFKTNHIKILRDIVRSYRAEPDAKPYQDVAGLCKIATLKEIEEKNWSLNPGRYVGVAEREAEDFEFVERLEELNEEFEKLELKRQKLKEHISLSVAELLEKALKNL